MNAVEKLSPGELVNKYARAHFSGKETPLTSRLNDREVTAYLARAAKIIALTEEGESELRNNAQSFTDCYDLEWTITGEKAGNLAPHQKNYLRRFNNFSRLDPEE